MRLAHQFQGQTVKGLGYRQAGGYHVGRKRRPHCSLLLLLLLTAGVINRLSFT